MADRVYNSSPLGVLSVLRARRILNLDHVRLVLLIGKAARRQRHVRVSFNDPVSNIQYRCEKLIERTRRGSAYRGYIGIWLALAALSLARSNLIGSLLGLTSALRLLSAARARWRQDFPRDTTKSEYLYRSRVDCDCGIVEQLFVMIPLTRIYGVAGGRSRGKNTVYRFRIRTGAFGIVYETFGAALDRY